MVTRTDARLRRCDIIDMNMVDTGRVSQSSAGVVVLRKNGKSGSPEINMSGCRTWRCRGRRCAVVELCCAMSVLCAPELARDGDRDAPERSRWRPSERAGGRRGPGGAVATEREGTCLHCVSRSSRAQRDRPRFRELFASRTPRYTRRKESWLIWSSGVAMHALTSSFPRRSFASGKHGHQGVFASHET